MLGRDFTERDGPGAPPVTVINEHMARFYFPGQSPIGKHVHVKAPTDVLLEIVGVARDAQDHGLRAKPVRRFYVSYLQPIDGITTANLEIRAAGVPARCSGRSARRSNASIRSSPSSQPEDRPDAGRRQHRPRAADREVVGDLRRARGAARRRSGSTA